MKHTTIITSAALLFASVSAYATPTFYFGEDLDWESSNVSTNADAASASFQSSLVGVGTETFESFSDGQTGPLAINFGASGTATLTGSGEVEGDGCCGRRAYSGVNFWETSSQDFVITFSNAIAAFGFYGIDLGDFAGQVTVTLGNGSSTTYDIPHSTGSAGSTNGNLLFWGIIDTANLFTSITFANTGSGSDYFGFDNFTIGTAEQVRVPAPAGIALIGLGLMALGFGRKKA